ncbi:RdgB/HAM1 family non-canonical purine NTP pyrophosphatase [Candidatus Microgenomates bacterium]|nr:RdgB/HAM1 family non-canonical purine NTP pyrophosphatase [Candidatus Microgenomates bacterium]
MKQLVIATRNKGKIREIRKILSDIPVKILSLDDVGFRRELKETGKTYEENARIKAETVGKKTGLLTLGEDSGLEIDALGGKPGLYSARHRKGTDTDKLNKLLRDLKGFPKEKRTAKYVAVVAVYNPQNKKTYVFKGESHGQITDKPQGTNGFGYDPIFYNFDLGKTNAQAFEEEKNRVSHRARALEKAKRMLFILSS